MIRRFLAVPLAFAFACALLPAASSAQTAEKDKKPAQSRQELAKDVQDTIAQYKKADPGIDRFFKQSAGYAVFARVGKVGFIVGGGQGSGEVFEKGRVVGVATITLGSIGLQAGAQEFSQIVFFKDQAALDRFKQNKFEFSANASAVAVKAGASGGADYSDGVAVFTRATGGLMAEASLGGQKFNVTMDAAPAKK